MQNVGGLAQRPERNWPLLSAPWLIAFVALSAAPILRLGDIQAVELLEALWLSIAALFFAYNGLRIPISGLWREYGMWYAAFLCCCLGVSLLSLRLTFYPPSGFSILKSPFYISLARIAELFLAVLFMLVIAEALRKRRVLLKLALDACVWAGVLSAAFGIASWAALEISGVTTFAVYGYDDRVRGFFNEGGPYGVFLISAGLAALIRRRLFPPRIPFMVKIELGLLFIALCLSGSKAGFLCVVSLCLLAALSTGTRVKRFVLLGMSILALAFIFSVFGGKFFGYAYAYLNVEEAISYRPDDPNLIMGRIVGALIVPRMIAAHPITGIGLGNYSLMRNDPQYLQGLPPVDDWDLPGLGLFGSAAELGIPVSLALMVLLSRPFFQARRVGAPAVVLVASGFQPVALALGVNLNFFYPWLVSAIAIAAAHRFEPPGGERS